MVHQVEFDALIDLGFSPLEAKSRLSSTYIEIVDYPSMVEPCYCPTIGELLLHPDLMLKYNEPLFDDGDDISDVDSPWERDDLQQQSFDEGRPVYTPRGAERSEAQRGVETGLPSSSETGVKGAKPPLDKTVPEGDTA